MSVKCKIVQIHDSTVLSIHRTQHYPKQPIFDSRDSDTSFHLQFCNAHPVGSQREMKFQSYSETIFSSQLSHL